MTNINTTFPLASTLLNDLRFLFVGSTEKAAYYADEISNYVLVGVDDLNLLESKLAAGIEGAYDEWCSETGAEELSLDGIKVVDEIERGDGVTVFYLVTGQSAQVMVEHKKGGSLRARGYVDGDVTEYFSNEVAGMLNELDQDALAEIVGVDLDEEEE